MNLKKIMTVVAIGLTTIVSVGCMEKETIAVEAPTTETEIVVEGTSIEREEEVTTSPAVSETTEVASSNSTNSTSNEVKSCECVGNCCAAAPVVETTLISTSTVTETSTTKLETTTTTVNEVEPEPTEPTTVEVVEEIVDTIITDVTEFFDEVETEIKEPEYIVYKPSTHYVHRSTCHWVDSTCYEITDTEGLEARICTECNPDIQIVTPYIPEPVPAETSSSISAEYLGNFRITGYVATGSKTASGTWPSAGRTIAMNAAQRKSLGLSYGQQIYIEGNSINGIYTIEDSGCGWGVVDVFCNSISECYSITSYADVYIIN